MRESINRLSNNTAGAYHMDSLFIIVSVLILSIGGTLFFVGSLASLLTALGNRQWYWGGAILLFLPISVVYCWVHRTLTNWPRKLVTIGGVLLLFAALLFESKFG